MLAYPQHDAGQSIIDAHEPRARQNNRKDSTVIKAAGKKLKLSGASLVSVKRRGLPVHCRPTCKNATLYRRSPIQAFGFEGELRLKQGRIIAQQGTQTMIGIGKGDEPKEGKEKHPSKTVDKPRLERQKLFLREVVQDNGGKASDAQPHDHKHDQHAETAHRLIDKDLPQLMGAAPS